MMDCERCKDLLPEYVGRAVPDDVRGALELHVGQCGHCREDLAGWLAVRASVARYSTALNARPPRYVPPPRRRPLWPALRSGLFRPEAGARSAFALGLGVLALASLWIWGLAPELGSSVRSLLTEEAGVPPVEQVRSYAPTEVRRQPTVVGRRPALPDALSSETLAAAGPASLLDAGSSLSLARTGAPISNQPPDPHSANSGTTAPIEIPTTTDPTTDPTADPAADPTAEERDTPRSPTAAPVASPSPAPPTPEPSATVVVATSGLITGMIVGPDGLARAEIWVVAQRPSGPTAEAWAMSGVDGRFKLELEPGEWIVHVESTAHPPMWHGGRPTPFDAQLIRIDAGAEAELSFHLESSPAGRISGTVANSDGTPLQRALVIAAFVPTSPGEAPGPAAAAFTTADGRFEMGVPPGIWLIGATDDPRGDRMTWWGGGSAAAAERLVIRANETGPALDLRLDP